MLSRAQKAASAAGCFAVALRLLIVDNQGNPPDFLILSTSQVPSGLTPCTYPHLVISKADVRWSFATPYSIHHKKEIMHAISKNSLDILLAQQLDSLSASKSLNGTTGQTLPSLITTCS
jgi:hypothetical protein